MTQNPPAEMQRLRALLTDPAEPREARSSGRAAAVLILLAESETGYRTVLVEKRPDLRSHAGQLAFPGGGAEPTDTDAVATALREAGEEVGVAPHDVDVLGILASRHVPRSGFDVTPVVGWGRRPGPLQVLDTAELSAVYQVEIETLVDPQHRDTWRLGEFSGPGFWVDDLYVWGFTAYLLDGLFDLFDWARPWDAGRTSQIPQRFRPGIG